MKKVVVLIVTYNRKKLLVECLNSINKQTYPISKIIVIDNHSSDGTNKLFVNNELFNDKNILYKRLSKNIGGAGGFYEGFKLALKMEFDWLWVMDDDTIPESKSLELLIDDANCVNKTNLSFIASSVFGPNHRTMNVPTISKSTSISGYQDWYINLDKGLVKIMSATFVSLLINKDAIKKVGLPLKSYFIWGDDTEYTLRLTKYFGDAYLSGKSRVLHKRSSDSTLSLIGEDNKNRIPLYFFLIRNELINVKEYFDEKRFILRILYWMIYSWKILISHHISYKFKKIFIIQKAILVILFRRYDYREFNGRLNL
ncbi:MAG: glycosyltransferase family 2 protein [Sporolactobacillus sp.]